MSDASDLYVPKWSPPLDKGVAVIKVAGKETPKKRPSRNNINEKEVAEKEAAEGKQLLQADDVSPISGKPTEIAPLVASMKEPVNISVQDPGKPPPVTIGAASSNALSS